MIAIKKVVMNCKSLVTIQVVMTTLLTCFTQEASSDSLNPLYSKFTLETVYCFSVSNYFIKLNLVNTG